MSYAPSTFNDGEYFFRKEGFIANDAVQLYGAVNSWPTASANFGTAATVTDSVIRGGGGTYWWHGWDLAGGPYDKVLATLYWHSTVDSISGLYIGATAVLDGSADTVDSYSNQFQSVDKNGLRKGDGNGSSVASQSTIYQHKNSAHSEIWGLGLYVEENVQKCFIRSGSSQWIETISATDGDYTSFYNVAVRGYSTKKRVITPFNVWVS